jgi:hypothetical protein
VGTPAEIVVPTGTKTEFPGSQQPTLLFTGTEDVGVYEVRQGQAPPRHVAVNLSSPAESDIRLQPDRRIKLGDADVAVSPTWQIMRRPIVKWLLLLALAVLMVEWYIYNRRVYV